MKDLENDFGFNTVKKKLENLIKNDPNYPDYERYINDTYYNITNFALILSDAKLFKQVFFGDYRTTEICNQLDKIFKEAEQDFSEEEIKQFQQKLEKGIKSLNNQKLEFRLTPLEQLKKFGHAAFFFANWINEIKLANWNYGAFHSSLILNGYVLEWDDSSLVMPNVDYEQLVSFSFEVEKDGMIMRILKRIKRALVNFGNFIIYYINEDWLLKDIADEELNKICEVCVRFNTNRIYSGMTINCQYFVDKVLEKLGIKLEFEGEMKREFEYFKNFGELDFKFWNYKFNTRKQLDEFAKTYYNELKKDEKKLLLLYKSTFEANRKSRFNETTQKFINITDEEIFGTTNESKIMWEQFEYLEKMHDL